MTTEIAAHEPFGPTTPARRRWGALIILAGAVPVGLLALTGTYDRPPGLYGVLTVIGLVALLAWLVDGMRYLGAGAASLALGLGIGISTEVESVTDYRNALVFGFLGLALLLVARVNPTAVLGSAGLLLFTAASATAAVAGVKTPFPEALVFAGLMVVWGALELANAGQRSARRPVPASEAAERPRAVMERSERARSPLA